MRTDDRYEQYTKNQQMRETIFREYPEIQKLDLAKNKWMCFLMSFMLIARIINIILLVQNGNSNLFLLIGANCIGYFTYFFILFFCMRVKAQNVYFLYILLFSLLNTLFRHLQNFTSLNMLIEVHLSLFQSVPLAAISDILLYIGFALHAGVTVWLTIIPKNRRLAKQFDTLMRDSSQFSNPK